MSTNPKTREDILNRMDELTTGDDVLTDDQIREYDALEADLKALDRSEELRARQAAYRTPAAGEVLQVNTHKATDPADDTLERAFEHYLRTGDPNQDIQELRAQSTTDAAGGYTIPQGFRTKIEETMLDFGGLAAEAETITTESGNLIEWPTLDDTANSGEVIAEAGTFAAGADLTFGTMTLSAFRYGAGGASNLPLKVSMELAQDSAFDLTSLVGRKLGERIARAQASDWINGTNSGEPQGLIAGSSADVTLVTSALNFTYAKLVDMVHAVDTAYRQSGNCKWLMADSTLAAIRKLVDSEDRPLWMPYGESGYQAPGAGVLLGYPVVVDQAVPTTGDLAKIAAFGDFRAGYIIRRVRDVQVMVLKELYAANGQLGYVAYARADGGIQQAAAFSVLADFDAP